VSGIKISVFFDLYAPMHEGKDPGQIPLGLMENGARSGIVTVTKGALDGYSAKFPVNQQSLQTFYNPEFWLKEDSDAIIAYPLQGAYYSPLIEKMKAGGKKVLLKFDSDGKIAYPLKRHYLSIPLRERLTLPDVLSDLWWRLSSESLKRRRHAKVAAEIIRQIELSDGAIIESPDALSNLNYFLTAWGRSDLVKKTHFVPNPVSPDYMQGEVGGKEKLVVSFGRWDDYRQKNTKVMVETSVAFLAKRSDYRFIIFGGGTENVKVLLSTAPETVKARIEVLGYVEHSFIRQVLAKAKMFFVPSRWESFSIASGEALCMGCSVVGTPVEALRYLSMQGSTGTIAATFDKTAILAALLQDTEKWDCGMYDPEKIAAYWRPKLDRRNIAKILENLAR